MSHFATPTADSGPTGIAVGPDGNLWFTEYDASKIGEINPATHAVTEFPTPTADSFPRGIAVGPDGNLWFTEAGPSKIGEINPTTHATADFATPAGNSFPFAITAGPDGNLWFTERNASRIGEINPATHATTDSATPSVNSFPEGIAVGPDGNLWFTENDANRIGEINPATDATADFPSPTANSEPDAITTGPDGNLWFIEESANRIGEINPITHSTADVAMSSVGEMYAIAAGPDGHLWVAGRAGIGEINPTSEETSEFPLSTNTTATGIAAGPDGNLWFAEQGYDEIGNVGAGAPAASVTAPVVSGSGQQGTVQQCGGDVWSNWAGEQPLAGLFGFDGDRWFVDGAPVAGGQFYTPTPANVGHRLSCSVAVTYPLLGTTTSASSQPVTVIPQVSGPQGPAGGQGSPGPSGLRGPAGEVELVTCKTTTHTVIRKVNGKRRAVKVTRQVCQTKLVSGPVKFTAQQASDAQAALSRAGVVYATGYAHQPRRGSAQIHLLAARTLRAGRYTLTLTTRIGHRRVTTRYPVSIR